MSRSSLTKWKTSESLTVLSRRVDVQGVGHGRLTVVSVMRPDFVVDR